MGLTKWLWKNGWGGIGAISRSVCKDLAKTYFDQDNFDEIREIYELILYSHEKACRVLNPVMGRPDLYDNFSTDTLIDSSSFDARVLVFIITCIEERQFRTILLQDRSGEYTMLGLDVIDEIVKPKFPKLCTLSKGQYIDRTMDFYTRYILTNS